MEKKNTAKPLKYSRVLWYSVMPLLIAAARLIFGARTDKTARKVYRKTRAPMLILANHVSPIDFIFVCQAVWPRHISFVVAENMYYQRFFAWFLDRGGVIWKKQFLPDFSCVRNIKNQIDAGVDVMLFPEGKVANDGISAPFRRSSAKLIKWLNCPVAVMNICGAGVSNPKWAVKRNRKGRVETTVKVVLSAEETQNLSQVEIFRKISAAIEHNEHEWQQRRGLKFRSARFAEGLENILFKCPVCGESYTFDSKNDVIECANCGLRVRYCNDGSLVPLNADAARGNTANKEAGSFSSSVPDRIDRWSVWQRACVRKEAESSADFSAAEEVSVMIPDEKARKMTVAGKGTLTLTRGSLTYDGTLNGEKTQLTFGTEFLYTVACQPGKGLDLYDDNNIYHFRFKERRAPYFFVTVIEEIYGIKHPESQE
ncbi:MAG: 1-acyl-sn-glycerol-3-phosphate acyltransferase [Clostridiales bacterium]|nr:1-acyl-sn-glycerol-3-phosphate acyltransferase [Clostridiales bacterium]